ncbi:hypothetical protein PIB30_018538 [Stylosanthes scabra]|uniref:PRA1 family protein n=1 Tax=Stylosanthes scabra TaxID=79078 RepID=A0ABU6Z5J0_9FABA|nr:hypothetical protein [Stylosanthes scabra]
MTTYGTIPATTSSSSPSTQNLVYISRVKNRVKAGLGTRRPWKTMFDPRSFGIPTTISQAMSRLRINVPYFRMNYAMLALFILFISLLWHPISLIVFLLLMSLWLFLYFLRDQPLLLYGHVIDDRIIVVVMTIFTVAVLLLTDATVNILVAVAVGVMVVAVHAAFRKTQDLFLDEEVSGLVHNGGAAA